jgi:hypothetical protein
MIQSENTATEATEITEKYEEVGSNLTIIDDIIVDPLNTISPQISL